MYRVLNLVFSYVNTHKGCYDGINTQLAKSCLVLLWQKECDQQFLVVFIRCGRYIGEKKFLFSSVYGLAVL